MRVQVCQQDITEVKPAHLLQATNFIGRFDPTWIFVRSAKNKTQTCLCVGNNQNMLE